MSAVRQPALPTGTVSNMTGLQRQLVISRPEASVGVISKVLLKAVGSAKKDSKTLTLRNVDPISVNTQEKLKLLIRTQLQKDVSGDFDVGFLQGSTVVNIRSSEDLDEVWNDIRCDGLKEMTSKIRKRKQQADDSEDDFDEDADIGKASCARGKLMKHLKSLERNTEILLRKCSIVYGVK